MTQLIAGFKEHDTEMQLITGVIMASPAVTPKKLIRDFLKMDKYVISALSAQQKERLSRRRDNLTCRL